MKNDIGAAACGTGKFGNELRADSIQEKLAAEWTGLHERPADARMQPSARGLLRPNGRKFKMKNEELKMRLGSQLAKEPHTSGLADARMQPSARGGLRAAAVPCGTANSEFKIQDSKLPIGTQPAEAPATLWSCVPPPPLSCGPHGLFKVEIQHSGFNMKRTPMPAASNPTAVRAFRRSAPPRFSLPEIHLQQLLGGDERRNLLVEDALFEHADPLLDGRVVVE